MKLRGKHVVTPYRRGEVHPIFGAGGHNRFILRFRVITVHEIKVAARFDPLQDRAIGLGYVHFVPPNLGHFDLSVRETYHAAFKNPEASRTGIEFLTVLEEGLVSHADTEKRFAGENEFARRFKELLLLHGVDAIIKSAHSRQDNGIGLLHQFWTRH